MDTIKTCAITVQTPFVFKKIVINSHIFLLFNFFGNINFFDRFFPRKKLGTQILDVLHRCIQENFGDLKEDRLI